MVRHFIKKIFFVIALILMGSLSNLASAQYIDIDSLEVLLTNNPPDSAKVKLLYKLSRELVYVDPLKAMRYAEESLDMATKLNSRLDEAYAYRILSSIYASQKFYSLSTAIGLKAQRIFEEEGDSLGLANNNITAGNLYRIQNLHKKAAEHHKLAYDYFKKHGPSYRFAITSLNYGEALYYLDSLDKAKKMQYQAIRLNNENNNVLAQTFSYKSLGLIYKKEDNFDSAQYYFEAAIEISKELGDNSQKASTLESMIELADMYDTHGREEEQVKLLEQAEQYALKYHRSIELEEVYFQLVKYYAENKNIDMAHEYLDYYQNIKDSLLSVTISDRENLLNTVYNSMKVGVENEVLEEQQAYSESLIKKQQTYLIIVAVLAIIAFFALLYAMVSRAKLQNSVKLLNEQKEQIRHKSEELEELVMTKDKMFSIISHDLRSPLQSIIGFSELVKKHMNSLSQEEVVEMMNQLSENVSATLKMTDNLIQWGRLQMEQSSVSPMQFNMAEIIKTLKDVYQPLAEQKDIALTVQVAERCTVYADPNHAELILRNLVNNAIKFTESKGEIKIICWADKDYTSISVEDTGRGIPESMMNDLFNLKITSTRGTAGEKGTGLGLMLCQEYALQNNGKIEVESKEGEGSVFKLYLPNKAS
ncbi:tetratricopeptide repeat-containing sensor histidine kinase [Fulvivirga lutimaris]|uniref:tetratricopeptide repeat-containing sensor histidine kinase n=1 Tax=Fulvivirga lutimaris TaxID=1819566 RepID=UPI0012BCAA0B|nr:tetratricopeptide repeat-containing sensor histidine kinase [Fulvivirga lutimaris]MTI40215.1 sensor histidine kinase [Fulvivirga lutimaris]